MMAETTAFELVSPEKLLVAEPAEMVVVPGTEGDFGALPRHAPMITGVRPGVIDIYQDGKVANRIFVAGGFAEVTETRVTVLAEEAIPLTSLSAEQAEARLSAAEDEVKMAAGDHAKREAARRLAIAQAMRAAVA
jgi:F-type H+-transporting ATPase subunit epsilon